MKQFLKILIASMLCASPGFSEGPSSKKTQAKDAGAPQTSKKTQLRAFVLKQQVEMLVLAAKNIRGGVPISAPFNDPGTIYLDYLLAGAQKELPKGFRYLKKEIAKVSSKRDLAKLTGLLGSYALKTPVKLYRGKDGSFLIELRYNTPYSLTAEKQGEDRPKAFVAHFPKYFEETIKASGWDGSDKSIKEGFRLLKTLSTQFRVKKNPTMSKGMKLSELRQVSKFRFDHYISEMAPGVRNPSVRLSSPGRMVAFTKVFKDYSLDAWKALYIFSLTDAFSDYMANPFQKRKNEFTAKVTGSPVLPRPVRGAIALQRLLPSQLSKAYALSYLNPEAKYEMDQLVAEIRGDLQQVVKTSKLDRKTKSLLLKKLKSVQVIIGYPEKIEYPRRNIKAGELVGNIMTIRKEKVKQDLGLEKRVPVALKTWQPNIAFNKKVKSLYIPAALLQTPFALDKEKPEGPRYYLLTYNFLRVTLSKTLLTPMGILKDSQHEAVLSKKEGIQEIVLSYLKSNKMSKRITKAKLPEWDLEKCVIQNKCSLAAAH